MKLAAIYNVFDGEEHLPHSMQCLKDHVDLFVIVWQDVSNFGEKYESIIRYFTPDDFCGVDLDKVLLIKFDPRLEMGGGMNERAKRNLGINAALNKGCTHFLNVDCDEYYRDFAKAKAMYIESGHRGSVCRLHTYFKKPTLRLETPEDYYVPFIHAMDKDTTCGTSSYKFYTDPTRTVNEQDVVELPIFMHHYSWVRLDIDRKVRNSSAKFNIARGTLVQDYNSEHVAPGFHVRDYQRKLVQVDDYFNLSPIFDSLHFA